MRATHPNLSNTSYHGLYVFGFDRGIQRAFAQGRAVPLLISTNWALPRQ